MLKRWRASHIGTNSGKSVLRQRCGGCCGRIRALAGGPVGEELARRIPAGEVEQAVYEEDERGHECC